MFTMFLVGIGSTAFVVLVVFLGVVLATRLPPRGDADRDRTAVTHGRPDGIGRVQ